MTPRHLARAQQRETSRAAILDAAISRYGEVGPAGASLREIASTAGVTHPLVLQYFDSKAGLIAAVGDRLTGCVSAEVAAAGSFDDAETFARLLRTARNDRSSTKLLIRSALGDLSPDGFPACLAGPWSSRTESSDDEADRRAQACQYAAASLLLGWLTFDGFMTSAVRLGNMGERRRDEAIAAVAAHLWALAGTDGPPLDGARPVSDQPASGEPSPLAGRSARDALLASAVELFAERGPASASVRDVARHAGLNHGLLHRHFGSKEALIAEAIEAGVASLMPGVLAPGGLDIDRVVQVMHQDPVPARLIARTLVDDIAIGSVRPRYPVLTGVLTLARGVPSELRPPCLGDPRLAAASTASMVAGSVIWGASLRAAGDFHDDVHSAMADLSHHLLGVARR
jgi:AcrR family transcriptional regulator